MGNRASSRGNFRRSFLRGLAVVLPATLTLWILVQAYLWVNDSIASPINSGIQFAMQQVFAAWPAIPEGLGITPSPEELKMARAALDLPAGNTVSDATIITDYRMGVVESWWANYWPVRMIGLLVAVVAVYLAGRFVGGWMGRAGYRWIERLISSVPVVKKIYSWIKQVVDFLFNQRENPINFSRVVAVQYPRRGIWSVGFQTGHVMKSMADSTDDDAITVFIPSSPTPFTGYTITVPRKDTINLPLTVEEAIGFTISAGVLRPPSEYTDQTLIDAEAMKAEDPAGSEGSAS
ncbi:MAG: DUF502 domain-containing protein [Phycisphaerales bacterium]|nr:DUF502 domain-containing protein [Phycisphaerales bacterium]